MSARRLYHPYRRSERLPSLPVPPATSPPIQQLHQEAAKQLEFYNAAGVLVTWDHSESDWQIFTRPTCKIGNSSNELPVGAASFPAVPNMLYPLCPHLDAYGHPYAQMALHLNKQYRGSRNDFFQARDHRCEFVVIVPKIRASIYSTEATYHQRAGDNNLDEEEVHATLLRFSPSPEPTSNPRISVPTASAPTRPRPQPLATKGRPAHHSFFSTSVANSRAFSDISVIDECWAGILSGEFETDPSSHPAFPKPGKPTHPVLRQYDEHFNPHCLRRTYQHLQFMDTGIGLAIRALNSTLGVTSDVVQTLIDNSIKCPGCSCQYSLDGFDNHIRDGRCGNRPELIPVAKSSVELRPSPADLESRQLPPGKCLGTTAEFLDSPIGAALLEWNSRLGIPTDVWAVASTAIQECETCSFVRSFPAHAAHLHPETGPKSLEAAFSHTRLYNSSEMKDFIGPAFVAKSNVAPSPALSYLKATTVMSTAGTSRHGALTSLYWTSTSVQEYPSPITSSAPYNTALFSSFLLEATKVFKPFGPQTLAGYVGDYDAEIVQHGQFHQPLFKTQLWGRIGPRHLFIEPKSSNHAGVQTDPTDAIGLHIGRFYWPKHFVHAAPNNVHVDPTGLNIGVPGLYMTPNEIRVLLDLFSGNPVNNTGVLQLLKRCHRCRKIYLPRSLPAHLAVCNSDTS
ncbi:hypothetical protein C8R45DRAFT_1104221 [Mycena sanguinolenta]|nr:hypothetical protein C8R45DRAFT_1104221 [Mycena sanguinolenta]